MQAVELGPVAERDQTQTSFDLFLIFAGANIVATTLQVGASLAGDFTPAKAMTVMVGGAIGGAALVAALAPLGPKLGVPSIVASRAALGLRGAGALATLLFVTNFAWIALNNVIAASITARLAGAESTMPIWAAALGLVATAIVAGGPRLVGLADRVAVPALAISAIVMTLACLRMGVPEAAPAEVSAMRWLSGFDVTAGYQVTWLLMFADYSRYSRSGRSAGVAVFLGLAVTAAWFMPLGYAAARIAGSDDPGRMIEGLGLGWWGGALVVLATLTTNFVNIYMSALALKSLRPRTTSQAGVWLIGGIGAALSVVSTSWLNRFADFTLLLAGLLVPIGGILLAHYFVLRRPVSVPDLYDTAGPYSIRGGWSVAGTVAWVAGATTFYLAGSIGGTLPALAVAIVTYAALARKP